MLREVGRVLTIVDNWIWGVPLLVLIFVVGVYLTVRLGFLQIFHLPKALRYIFQAEKNGEGEVSSFGALCTALSATIGTGNIVGVAMAICAGGPGALFWMLVAAFFGMATKYAEGLLAIKYRKIDETGHVLGGPFYYIENGMGSQWKWLGKLFALFGMLAGLLGIGTLTQVSGIITVIEGFFDPQKTNSVSLWGMNYSYAAIIGGTIITVLVALIIIGGIKRITKVSEIVVPVMAILYVFVCLSIIILNIGKLPSAFVEIVSGAFGLRAATGGIIGAMLVAVQNGVARGIFSNEAGLGSAPIAAAAAKTNEPVRQGLVSMTGTFIDTIIICTLTGLTIILTGAWNSELGLTGANVTSYAFDTGLWFLPTWVTQFIIMVCLTFFAFTTILGWNYYGERCFEYLTGSNKATFIYKWLYIGAVFIAPYLTISAVWTIADIFNGLMAFPNLIAIAVLSGVIVSETKKYMDKL